MQPVALAARWRSGSAASLLRMAFGGHFLSDTLFAALFTWLVIIAPGLVPSRSLVGRPLSFNASSGDGPKAKYKH